eukprot:TRINITY_DN775915_c0_g1_i1.p1 TRINITY_DN775915_c0_g1~~TRINITY_DN775915_c0_g1_i1.p1  ORF type:complete len:430 (-),score=156.25 TRINITY_DN775915_c0_g1_i1:84-1373(-)
MSSTLEEGKAYLQKESEAGVSCYDFLTNVLMKVLVMKPEDPVKALEQICVMEKQNQMLVRKNKKAKLPFETKSGQSQLEWANKNNALFKNEGESTANIQNLIEACHILEWGGVTLSREQLFRMNLSMNKLAQDFPVKSLRLWGRINGQKHDYYIVEADFERESGEIGKDSRGVLLEKPGEGANKMCYFVCTEIAGEWELLPDVTPEQIVIARQIRRYMTGDLDADVPGYPPFPGTERNFLRAQIARINSETAISPSGIYVRSEEEDTLDIIPNPEEIDVPEELNELANWVHHAVPINKLGRCLPQPPKLDEDGEPIEDPDAPEEPELLAAIGEEEDMWSVRRHPASYAHADSGLVSVRSLRWPGAVAMGFGAQVCSLYIGDAVEYLDHVFTPAPLPALSQEFNVETHNVKEQLEVVDDPSVGKEEDEEE